MSDHQFYQMGDEPTVSTEASMFPTFNDAFSKSINGDVTETVAPVEPKPVTPTIQTIPIGEDPFQADEDLEREAIINHLSELTQLIPLHDSIKKEQAISIEHVRMIDSIVPDLIATRRAHALYSAYPSIAGLQVATEALGESIIKRIKSLLTYVVNAIQRLGSRIRKFMSKDTQNLDFDALKAEYDKILDKAAEKDAVKGIGFFKERYGDTPIGKKSSSYKHFVQLTMSSDLKARLEQSCTIGIDDISKGLVKATLADQNQILLKLVAAIEQSIKDPTNISAGVLNNVKFPFIVMNGDLVDNEKSKTAVQELGDKLNKETKASVTNVPTICIMAQPSKDLRKTSKELAHKAEVLAKEIEQKISKVDEDPKVLVSLKIMQSVAAVINLTSTQQVLYYQHYERLHNLVNGVIKAGKSLV